ncbi:GH15 family glucan-1,4-alpha-glucosidase [Kribbella amoyensis]|uniref:GH15 family glucan-1,4-alpha-glucosidase n=1 Tax=Kribbella amoyensis TaxID=996641 RepID=A0A561BME4_9ACTN|nr:glycoside hydrolase family 15 protein [Kribbella amoyensis]TWD80051.1 GH15 family glucan-1,4-alpha-glucosidase [Kribbella amoyensis]
MAGYPPIADHGLIGDLQTAALVTTDGTIDWYCCPRFDSPSVFGALLDQERGGRFSIAPVGDCTTKQLYFPDTAVLITRFMTPDGVGELIDLMPVDNPGEVTDRHRIVRGIRCVRGTMRFTLDCAPRFGYGRQDHEVEVTDQGAVFRTHGLELTLHGPSGLEQRGKDVHGDLTLQAGQLVGVILESAADGPPRTPTATELTVLAEDTARYWREWLATSRYRGRWREMVNRSAITLKLMTYAPSGALVAAPTTGLPEQVGGERNWDYRYTWIRDASMSVHALLGLGFTDEAAAFLRWISGRAAEQVGKTSGPLKIMYRIDGSSDLDEDVLDHLNGYAGSRPVRVGNGAADQLQLDIYGEMLDAVWAADQHGLRIGHPAWTKLSEVTDWLCQHWDQPDEGVWETRGGRQNFTYGRLMCWVALDRMVRLAREHGRPADLERWEQERDRIYHRIMERGWNAERKAFTQHDRTDVLDASLLMMPLVGFVVPHDPLWLSTLDAMNDELVSDSLVYRYNPSASPDGLRGGEGTFSICTFWYVEALARSGRLEMARYAFEKMFTYANHVGLYAEEVGLTGEQLGNFPQAFTHLSLINAALALDAALDRTGGQLEVRPEMEARLRGASR